MRRLTIPFDQENAVPHVIYDLTIQDVNERREKAVHVPTGRHAATFLGIDMRKLWDNRTPGRRIYSSHHGKHFAVRIAKPKTA